jgi:hypothetical protein
MIDNYIRGDFMIGHKIVDIEFYSEMTSPVFAAKQGKSHKKHSFDKNRFL